MVQKTKTKTVTKRISKNCGINPNYICLLEYQKEKRETWVEEIFKEIIVDNFPKLMTWNLRFKKFREHQAG